MFNNKTSKQKSKIYQHIYLGLQISTKNIEKNPYLKTLEDGLKKMKEEETTPSPSFCSKPNLAQILA